MKINKFLLVVCIILLTVFLTSCWDKTEINEREFVISVGIDKNDDGENRYSISMSSPEKNQKDNNSKDKDSKDKNSQKKSGNNTQGLTISDAFRKSGANSNKKPYYGHTKACVISRKILEDEKLFKETLDTLLRNSELSKKIIVLAADGEADEIIQADVSDSDDIGIFISEYYKNSRDNNGFKYDLGELIRKFRISGDNLLPEIKADNGNVELNSAAVIKNYSYAGSLDEELLNGYLWVKGKGTNMRLSVDYRGISVPIKLDSVKRKVTFEESNGNISAIIKIDAVGFIEEYIFNDDSLSDAGNIEALSNLYDKKIADEILKTSDVLQHEYNVDAFDFLEDIRKKNYGLYLRIADNWDEIFSEVEIVTDIKVTVKKNND